MEILQGVTVDSGRAGYQSKAAACWVWNVLLGRNKEASGYFSGSVFWDWFLEAWCSYWLKLLSRENCSLLNKYTQAHTHTDTSTHMCTHIYRQTQAQVCMYTHMHTQYTHIQRHKHTHIRQKHIYTSIHTHTYTHMHTHIHIHISTQTKPLKKCLIYLFLIEFDLQCCAGFRYITTWFSLCILFFSREAPFLNLEISDVHTPLIFREEETKVWYLQGGGSDLPKVKRLFNGRDGSNTQTNYICLRFLVWCVFGILWPPCIRSSFFWRLHLESLGVFISFAFCVVLVGTANGWVSAQPCLLGPSSGSPADWVDGLASCIWVSLLLTSFSSLRHVLGQGIR